MQLFKKLGAVAVALVMATATILPMVSVDVSAAEAEYEFDYAYDAYRSPDFPASGAEFSIYNIDNPLDNNGSNSSTSPEGTWELHKVGNYTEYMSNVSSSNTNNHHDLETVVNEVKFNNSGLTDNTIIVHQLKHIDKNTNVATHVAYGVIIAHDITQDIMVFFGDTWAGGAGYVLSNNTLQMDGRYIINATKTAEDMNNNYYVVAFVADGKVVDRTEIAKNNNGLLTLPTVPSKDGYTGAWDYDGNAITEDTTITAVYTAIPSEDEDKTDDTTTPVEKPAEPVKDKTPSTGDDTNAVAWMAILLLSGAALAGLGVNRKFNAN